jgi:cation transport ATPase
VGKTVGDEVRSRLPRLTMSLVLAVIFFLISVFVPPLMGDIDLPGINFNVATLVGIIALIFTAIFLIRALADGLVLSDIFTDIFVKRLGIKEERSPKRAARDAIYIIVILLVATAIYPIISTLDSSIKDPLTAATTYVALAIILILFYDIGRILYRIVERKAESVADGLAKMADKKKNRE